MLGTAPRTAKLALSILSGVLASCALATAAVAAPVTPGPAGMAFYTPPPVLPGAHGALIYYRPATINFGVFGSGPSIKAWTVLYESDSVGTTPDAVTGTIMVPTAPWTGSGPRPVVDYAVGTQGLAQSQAPSLQFVAGSEYEGIGVTADLNKGWAVEITDNAGYTNGGVPDYIVGQSEGHAVLDIGLAALQIPNSGISASAPVITQGYSQGGGSSAWAAQLAPSYAPALHLVGDASGGIPSNLGAVADSVNGALFAAFGLDAIIGMSIDYPTQLNLPAYINAAGAAAIKQDENDPLANSITDFAYKNVDQYTVNDPATGKPWTLDQLLAVPSIAAVVSAQALGGTPITVPMFQFHGSFDEIVPLTQDQALNKTYCSKGDTVDWKTYPGDHILTMVEASGDEVAWMANRFAGSAAPHNC